jgi:hypothetical protein
LSVFEISMQRQAFAGHVIKVIKRPLILSIEFCISLSALDTGLIFLIVRLLVGSVLFGRGIKRNFMAIKGFASITYHPGSVKKDLIKIDELLEIRLRLNAVTTVGRFSFRFNERHLAS